MPNYGSLRDLCSAVAPVRWLLLFWACAWMLFHGATLSLEVAKFGEMREPLACKTTYQADGRSLLTSYSGGFCSGAQALVHMGALSLGVGLLMVAGCAGPGACRIVAALVSLAWYGLGAGAYGWYRRVAPAPDAWPLYVVAGYLLVGLVPLGLASTDQEASGRRRRALLRAGAGALAGAGAGALLGTAFQAAAQSLKFAPSETVFPYVVRVGWWPQGLLLGAVLGATLAGRRVWRKPQDAPSAELTKGAPSTGEFPAAQPRQNPLPMLVGCIFAIAGLAVTLVAFSQFGEMQRPLSSHYVQGSLSSEGGMSYSGGFMPGAMALFGMLFLGVGVGVFAGTAGLTCNAQQLLALILALLWHGVGLGSCWFYLSLAPQPDLWPFAVMVLYEWLGAIPLASAVPADLMSGRLRSAVWYLMGGAFLGAVAGLLIGGVAGGVRVFLSSRHGDGLAGGNWWLYGLAGGAALVGASFAVGRLLGWEMPSGGKPAARPAAAGPMTCPQCRHQVHPGLDACPHCHGPIRRDRLRALGKTLSSVGFVCVLTAMFMGQFADRLQRAGIDTAAQAYLFWLLMIGGLVMLGAGKLLGSGQPAATDSDRSGKADPSFPSGNQTGSRRTDDGG